MIVGDGASVVDGAAVGEGAVVVVDVAFVVDGAVVVEVTVWIIIIDGVEVVEDKGVLDCIFVGNQATVGEGIIVVNCVSFGDCTVVVEWVFTFIHYDAFVGGGAVVVEVAVDVKCAMISDGAFVGDGAVVVEYIVNCQSNVCRNIQCT